MLTLYYKPTCPYCQEVLGKAEELGVQFRLKDISSDSTLKDELIEQGGKSQVPFLIDTDKGVKMYESTDIVRHLEEFYKNGTVAKTFGGLTIHASEEVCDTCQ